MNYKRFFNTSVLLLLAFISTFAQNNVTSPYSFLGLGDNYKKGNIRALSMGGTDMALRNNMYINFLNPAGLSGIDTMSFVGSVGVAMTNTAYRTSNLTSEFSSANINHLAVAFPITKWWRTSIALLPFSSIGYEVYDDDFVDNVGSVEYQYLGSGGVDEISWANAFSINKNLAVGINASYYFGKIEHDKSVYFPDSIYMFNSLVREKVVLNGFIFQLGLQYFLPLDDETTLGFGLVYGNNSNFKTKTDYFAVTYLGDDLYNNTSLDTITKWDLEKGDIKMPMSIGGGISWVKKDKLTLAADFRFENYEEFQYQQQILDLSNKFSTSFGAEFIPESNNLSAYWKMIHYRLGFRYENFGIKFANNELREYAISAGFGLPLRKSKTFVNLGLELGQNGTIQDDLIQERFFRVMLGISIKETWFRKSKYF